MDKRNAKAPPPAQKPLKAQPATKPVTVQPSVAMMTAFQKAAQLGPRKDEATCPIVYDPRDDKMPGIISKIIAQPAPKSVIVEKLAGRFQTNPSKDSEKVAAAFVTIAQWTKLKEQASKHQVAMAETRVFHSGEPCVALNLKSLPLASTAKPAMATPAASTARPTTTPAAKAPTVPAGNAGKTGKTTANQAGANAPKARNTKP